MSPADWEQRQARSFACLIGLTDTGQAPRERWLLLFHPDSESLPFALPPGDWQRVLDSVCALVLPQARWGEAETCAGALVVPARALLGLVQPLAMPTPSPVLEEK